MLLFNRYEYNPQTDIAGRGDFSRVYKAGDITSGEMVALKIYKINDLSDHYRPILNTQAMCRFEHPSLCRYFDIQEIEKEDSFGEKEKLQVCVSSFINAGNLVNWYQKQRNASLLKDILPGILHGLSYLHQKGLIHGYIKPSNILVAENNGLATAVITDYAMGIFTAQSSASTGSHPLLSAVSYFSPEQLNAVKYGKGGKISFNTDFWSLGLVIYEALTGEPLFKVQQTDFPETITGRITSFELPAAIHSLPAPFPAFLSACLVKDAGVRAQTVAELLATLSEEMADTDNTRIIALPGKNKKTAIYFPEEDEAEEAETRIIAKPVSESAAEKEIPDEDTTQIIKKPTSFFTVEDSTAEDTATGDDTKIIAKPVLNSTPEKETPDEDATQIIKRPAAFAAVDNGTAEDTATDDDTKIIAKPVLNSTPKKEIPDEDATQIIKRLVAFPAVDNSTAEDTETDDDTKIIAKPVLNSTPEKETPDEDATQIIKRPVAFAAVDNSTAEDTATDDDTKIIAKPVLNSTPEKETPDEDATQIIKKPVVFSITDDNAEQENDSVEDHTKIITLAAAPVQVSPTTIEDNTQVLKKAALVTLSNNEQNPPENSIGENTPAVQAGGIDNNNVQQNTDQGEDDPAIDQTIILSSVNKETKTGSHAAPAIEVKQTDVVIRRREKPVILFNRYEYLPATDLIGKGGFSRVYKAYDKKLSRWVALKIYKTGEFSERYSPIAEIKRVVNLDHSNICRYLDIEEMENENPFGENEKIQVCVMELLDSGNFAEYYKAHKDPVILKKLVQDILNGLSYLHKNGIIHRDIKPANILIKETIDGPVAKITDFGISKNSDTDNNNSSSALVVSIPYMAPEQLNAKKYGVNDKVSFNLDLWSLGVTIYEVFTGKVLFKNSDQDNSEQIMANIMAPEMPDKLNDLPEPFKTVVSHCVIKNARERAARAEELMVLLNTAAVPGTTAALVSQAVNSLPNAEKAPIALQQPEQPVKNPEPVIITSTDKPVAKKPVSRFSVDEPIEKPVQQKEKNKEKENDTNKNRPLIIFISAAVVVFILFVLFLKTCNQSPTETNTATQKPDSVKKAINSLPPADTMHSNALPEKKTDTSTTSAAPPPVVKPLHVTEKKKEKLPEETHKKTAPLTETSTVTGGSKYVLAISSEIRCQLKVNGISYGEVTPGKIPMRIYLGIGKYVLLFTSSSNPASSSSANIEVKPENIGHANKYRVPLR